MKSSTSTIFLILSAAVSSASAFVVAPQNSWTKERTALFSTSAVENNQAAYGETEELPDSYVRCGKCEAVYAIAPEDLGRGKGRRLECSVCSHSWFQSKDRLMELRDDFTMDPLPDRDLDRIQRNIEEGKSPKFMGEKKLYVGNIPFDCHEEDFYTVFSQVGEVGDVSLVRDENGNNRGFGFVTMRTEDEAQKAVDELDGLAIRGRNIAVRESNN